MTINTSGEIVLLPQNAIVEDSHPYDGIDWDLYPSNEAGEYDYLDDMENGRNLKPEDMYNY